MDEWHGANGGPQALHSLMEGVGADIFSMLAPSYIKLLCKFITAHSAKNPSIFDPGSERQKVLRRGQYGNGLGHDNGWVFIGL